MIKLFVNILSPLYSSILFGGGRLGKPMGVEGREIWRVKVACA